MGPLVGDTAGGHRPRHGPEQPIGALSIRFHRLGHGGFAGAGLCSCLVSECVNIGVALVVGVLGCELAHLHCASLCLGFWVLWGRFRLDDAQQSG